jgi:hypothetical protein
MLVIALFILLSLHLDERQLRKLREDVSDIKSIECQACREKRRKELKSLLRNYNHNQRNDDIIIDDLYGEKNVNNK